MPALPEERLPVSENTFVPTFRDLDQAVEFIVACLDSGDTDKLGAACAKSCSETSVYPGLPPAAEYRTRAIVALQERHRQTRLERLYADRAFPATATTYKLGGHGVELGHIHIDFKKVEEVWLLEEIFICR